MEVTCGTVYPYNGTLLFGHRKGWDTDTMRYYNMNDSQKHYADAKGPVLDDSIYVKCPA